MPTINGTTYEDETPAEVIRILEEYRTAPPQCRTRLVLHYGYQQTGQAWGDVNSGYIGRSGGSAKIPILLHNTRSLGGGRILEDCIVKIETAKGKHLLWQHPDFKPTED